MSETEKTTTPAASASASGSVELQGLFAFKVGMSSVYNEEGILVPVTVLRMEPTTVTQIKTEQADGYEAVQVAFCPSRATRITAPKKGQLKIAGFENGALHVREIRQKADGITVGAKIGIESLKKGDMVKLTGRSKGRGFAGAVKRWNLAGGPAAHGSHFHRRPGSSGNRTWPGRVMPGKKFPGQLGNEMTTLTHVQVVDVIADEKVVLVKGSVPGAPNSLVKLMKVQNG